MANAFSGPFRPLIPIDSGHPFRCKPATVPVIPRDAGKSPIPDSALLVTLTVRQLRELIRGEIQSLNHLIQPLLTPEELASLLKVPLSWVYEQSRQGNIPTHRLGRYVRFNLQEVIESQKKKGLTP